MNIQTLSRAQSKSAYERIKEGCDFLSIDWSNRLDSDYLDIRNYLVEKYHELKQSGYKDYQLDYRFSLLFYNYFHRKEWMTDRIAADYEFWSYIALIVIPDLVFDRFGAEDDRHYYAKGLRIWPYTLYWYAHLSWQGDIEPTNKILSSSRCCSDTILNLVERPGRNGTYIDLYRSIMYHFVNCNPTKAVDNIKLFRSIMKLALAKPQVIDPDLCSGGASEYAKEIVQECVDKIDFTLEE
ncbi:MAG: hypothetical protein IJ190_01890 [Prevotella sp.]|nr:hypothetical protein [Prevotella sp.]